MFVLVEVLDPSEFDVLALFYIGFENFLIELLLDTVSPYSTVPWFFLNSGIFGLSSLLLVWYLVCPFSIPTFLGEYIPKLLLFCTGFILPELFKPFELPLISSPV
jgi:hypothetical protein